MNSVRVDILYVLECLNLLLANCYITSDLVYVLSQGAVHEFLFNRVDLLRESADAVEYYVQLLKAIIMRLSQP